MNGIVGDVGEKKTSATWKLSIGLESLSKCWNQQSVISSEILI